MIRPQLRTYSVGTRVAIAANLLTLIWGLGFLAYDYQNEFRHRLSDKAAALQKQAMTLHQAVAELRCATEEGRQQLIDAVCSRMDDSESPDHHIVVDVNGQSLQSKAHHRDSLQRLTAMRAAVELPPGEWKNSDLLVGRYAEGPISVYLSERMSNVRREIRRNAAIRSIGVGVCGLLMALTMNIAIHRLVRRPLRRLVATIDEVAMGNLNHDAGQFDGAELARVAKAIDAMKSALATSERNRRTSLERARRVQQNLLPRTGDVDGLEVAFFHRAAEDVAGDYLDVFSTRRGTTVICVADVAGHGIASALVAAMLKILLLDAAENYDDPADMVVILNKKLLQVTLPEAFATVFLAEWNPSTRSLRYVNAGHEAGVVFRAGKMAHFLDSTGPMIGIDADFSWETKSVVMAEDELLTCWTDGVTEALNRDGELLGRQKVIQEITNACAMDPQALIEVVDYTIAEHTAHSRSTDDSTAIAVRFARSGDLTPLEARSTTSHPAFRGSTTGDASDGRVSRQEILDSRLE